MFVCPNEKCKKMNSPVIAQTAHVQCTRRELSFEWSHLQHFVGQIREVSRQIPPLAVQVLTVSLSSVVVALLESFHSRLVFLLLLLFIYFFSFEPVKFLEIGVNIYYI